MNKIHIIYGCAIVLCLSGLLISFSAPKEKVAYVQLGEIYGKFEMTKELDEKITKVQESRQYVLDSLNVKLRALSSTLNSEINPSDLSIEQFKIMREEYLLKEKQYQTDNEAMSQQYTNEIWTQLNEYMKEYGKENGYSFIYGASGTGNIMYAEEDMDITAQVLDFVNQKYQGEK